MNSFKDKLRNLFNDELRNNRNINIDKNLNQTIIDTQRKIRFDNNSSQLTDRKSRMKNNLSTNFETSNNSNIILKNNKIIYKNNTLGNLALNGISYDYNIINKDNNNVNKIYKKLYNISYNNISTNNYNKIYLKYKNKKKPLLLINQNINQNNNTYISIINKHKINNNQISLRRYSSNGNIINQKNEYYYEFKENNNKNHLKNKSKLYSNTVYENLMINLQKKQNDAVIIKDKKRISSSIKKKINSIIGENDLENISYKNNISNKMPRILTSELFQFDSKYYNDISPLKKFANLNNPKNKKIFNYNNYNEFFNNDNYNKKLKSAYLSYYNLSRNKYT